MALPTAPAMASAGSMPLLRSRLPSAGGNPRLEEIPGVPFALWRRKHTTRTIRIEILETEMTYLPVRQPLGPYGRTAGHHDSHPRPGLRCGLRRLLPRRLRLFGHRPGAGRVPPRRHPALPHRGEPE